MLCPKCSTETRVIATHHFTDGIRRRHRCTKAECGHRFNTAQVLYGKPFAACRGKKMKKIDGEWVTAKSHRDMELKVLRAKRGRFTKEQRLAFIRKSLGFDSATPTGDEGSGDGGRD